MGAPAGERHAHPRRKTPAWMRNISLITCVCVSLILALGGASSSPSQRGGSKVSPQISNLLGGSSSSSGSSGGVNSHGIDIDASPRQASGASSASTIEIDAKEIIDEMVAASDRRDGTGSEAQEDAARAVKSIQVYRPWSSSTPSQHQVTRARRGKKKRSSHLHQEGSSLLSSLATLTSRTTHGLCRAVNVTGTATSVVAGGVFKLAGAAVLDAVDGMEYASAKSPTEVPGISEAYRFVTKGLRKTGEVVYDFGVAAENMTAEATEAAEETIRYVVGSVIETASGGGGSAYRDRNGNLLPNGRKRGYFAEEEDRIVDNMMFGMSAPDNGRAAAAETGDGGDADATMGYSDGDLSTQFGTDAARGYDRYGDGNLGGSSEGGWGGRAGKGVHHRRKQQQGGEEEEGRLALLSSSSSPLPPSGHVRRAETPTLAARARLAIRRSIMRTSKAVPSMRFPQMVACGMVFACRAVTTNPWFGAASFVGARVYLKFVESIYLECLKERMMSDIKFEAVARLHEGSPERARWFNTAVTGMWVPMLEPLIAGWAARQITAGIERSLPSNVSWVGLGKVTLGPKPPKIRYVQVQNVTSLAARQSVGQSNGVIDSILLEAGRPGGNIAGENVVYLELGVDWTSVRSKVSLKLGEQSRRRTWWSVRSYVPSYRVKLCDLGIKAKVIVAFAVGEGRPFVKRLWVGFAEPPLTHLSLEPLTGMDIANLPVLRRHLRHVMMQCLMPLTEPRHLSIEMKPPPPPASQYRGAALAARVRPAAAGVRKGILSRVPGFGLRQLMRNRARAAAAVEGEVSGDSGEGDDARPSKELEEATRRLLVEVGSELSETAETATGEKVVEVDGDEATEAGNGETAVVVLPPPEDEDKPSGGKARGSRHQRNPKSGSKSKPKIPVGDKGSRGEGRDEGDGVIVSGEVTPAAAGRKNLSHADENGPEEEPPGDVSATEEACSDEVETATAEAGTTAAEKEEGEAVSTPTNGSVALTTETAPVPAVASGLRKSEEVREHRAEIKRRRAARREQKGLSPVDEGVGFGLLKSLRRRFVKSPRSKKASPELDAIIQRVCALSRPPPPDVTSRML